MPNSIKTRIISNAVSVLRLFMTMVYLWVILLAAAVLPVPMASHTVSMFTSEVVMDVRYRLVFVFTPTGQLVVALTITSLLSSLFKCCRCNFADIRILELGDDPIEVTAAIYMHFIPFLMCFYCLWMCTTLLIVMAIARLEDETDTPGVNKLFGHLLYLLVFKILVALNCYSISVRSFAILKVMEREDNLVQSIPNYLNFGEYLNMFFRI
ncbi:hypothetical protein KR018_011530 [Drosophila ironensis]|nr:hypothetical protein KR018_011530 [Drosophila ironensis]